MDNTKALFHTHTLLHASQASIFGSNHIIKLETRIEEFYNFVRERHSIQLKRASGLPFPWTEDEILREYRFTNVYRELDKGTLLVTDEIIPNATSDEELLFQIICYRFLNEIETWHEIGLKYRYSASNLASKLLAMKAAGHRVFNPAYLIFSNVPTGSTKIGVYCRFVAEARATCPKLLRALKRAKNSAQAMKALQKLYLCGPFMAGQIMVDISYTNLINHINLDNFVIIGVGAKPGLDYIADRKLKEDEAYSLIREIHGKQYEYVPEMPYITLMNIQNCLCEFRKYVKIKNGGSHKRFKYGETNQSAG